MNSIGRVISVSLNKLIFEVSDFEKLNQNFKGFTSTAKGVMDYVTIIDDRHQKFIYQVLNVEDKEVILSKDENSKMDYAGHFECIPVGKIEKGQIDFNLTSYPFLQNKVYLTNEEDYRTIFSTHDSEASLNLGLIQDKYKAKIEISKIFNHHSAILGNTGSGKSTTIRQILDETTKLNTRNLRVHVFDVHNEYESLGDKSSVINVQDEYPIYLGDLDLQDWINLLKPSDLVQLPMLLKALKLSNLIYEEKVSEVWLKCFIAYTMYTQIQTDVTGKRTKIISILQGIDIDTNKYGAKFGNFENKEDEKRFLNSLKTIMNEEHRNKELSFLQNFMEKSQYKAISFKRLLDGMEYAFLLEECKGNAQARAHCGTLETRIKSVRDRYGKLLSGKTSFVQKEKQVTIYKVDVFEDDLLLFYTSFLMKKIFEKSRKKELKEREINIFILEEAHRYISKSKEDSVFYEIELYEKIAREGRKFGCFIFLSSQRPSELSSTVLSQCNNYLIHRIKNNLDLDYILKTIPYLNKNQLARISYLPNGSMYAVGELFPIPIEVKVHEIKKTNKSVTPRIEMKKLDE